VGINSYNLKKWTKMLLGKSLLHVNQPKGKYYEKNQIVGYYNDLTEKVTKSNYKIDEVPKIKNEYGEDEEFAIAIFQYGLGAFDLYLNTQKEEYLTRFKVALDWAIKNQLDNGAWKIFEKQSPEKPYSSMAQGEGVSLLLRAYIKYNEVQYLEAAKKAIDFMINDYNEQGTAEFIGEDVYLKEFINEPVVLNGWIFSIFGIYDYLLICKDDNKIKEIYSKTISTLEKVLIKYDLKYWSRYDISKRIASPFYHNLHVELLKVLYDLTDNGIFKEYAEKFEGYSKNKLFMLRAFINKAIQKVRE